VDHRTAVPRLEEQGLRLEDSQVESADRLLKLTAIATHAAALIMQLVQARDGQRVQPAAIAFTADEIAALHAIEADQYAPRTASSKTLTPSNPLLGPPGSSQGWADGMAIPPPNLQDPSPSDMASTTSTASPKAGACEMCESPSVLRGG